MTAFFPVFQERSEVAGLESMILHLPDLQCQAPAFDCLPEPVAVPGHESSARVWKPAEWL